MAKNRGSGKTEDDCLGRLNCPKTGYLAKTKSALGIRGDGGQGDRMGEENKGPDATCVVLPASGKTVRRKAEIAQVEKGGVKFVEWQGGPWDSNLGRKRKYSEILEKTECRGNVKRPDKMASKVVWRRATNRKKGKKYIEGSREASVGRQSPGTGWGTDFRDAWWEGRWVDCEG